MRVFGVKMISRKKKVTKRTSVKRRNPINDKHVHLWRVISYFDLIKGYSSSFDNAIRKTLDKYDIIWGGNATSVISMEALLAMLKEYRFADDREYIKFKKDLEYREEGNSSSGPWYHLYIVLEKL